MTFKKDKVFPSEQEALNLYREIEEKVSHFNQVWPKYVVEAYAYELPYYDFSGSGSELVVPSELAPTNSYVGDGAVMQMKAALLKFTKDHEYQHSNNVFKLPSIAIVDSLCELKPLIDEINEAKLSLQQTIGVYSPAGRNKFTNRVFPEQVMLQVYRKIHYFDFNIKRLVFSWTGKAVSYKKLTVEKAVNYVDRYYSRLDTSLSDSQSELIKETIKLEIEAKADRELRLRRELAPKLSLKAVPDNPKNLPNDDARGLKNSSIPMFAKKSESGPSVIPPERVRVLGNTDIRTKRSSLVPIEPRLGLYWIDDK